MMMQMTERRVQKNNLSSAMERFMNAVNDMDQTVMLPSMLRDLLPNVDEDHCSDAASSDATAGRHHHANPKPNVVDGSEGDMYSSYQLLKSMRRDMEWGVGGGWRTATTAAPPGATPPRRVRGRRLTRKDSSASLSSLSSVSSASSLASEESDLEEEDEEEEDEEDLEKRFQYHVTGLQAVLSKLTRQAVCLTDRYKQELGIGEWGKTTPSSSCLW